MSTSWAFIIGFLCVPIAAIPGVAVWAIYANWKGLGPFIDRPLTGHQEEGIYR